MKVVQRIHSRDNMATKYLQELSDGNVIETAYVDYYNKHIICFSSLIGCPIGCKFCISGQRRQYIRRLTPNELFDQCMNVLSDIDLRTKSALFSAMGEGEPLLNLDNILYTFDRLKNMRSAFKFAISTSGIELPLIRQLRHVEFDLKLQFSLHAANQKLRDQLIPTSQKLSAIRKALLKYSSDGKPVENNYILLGGVNDSMKHAEEIVDWCRDTPWSIKINQYNKFEGTPFETSENTEEFIQYLKDRGVPVEYYQTNGTDINAACGQMSFKWKEAR